MGSFRPNKEPSSIDLFDETQFHATVRNAAAQNIDI